MKRLVFFIVATIVATSFAVANSHHVEISLIVGAPVRMRMIFLLVGAFSAGVVSTLGIQEWRTVQRRRRDGALRRVAEERPAGQKDLLDGLDQE
jgi:uncharacterized integral membrane protein